MFALFVVTLLVLLLVSSHGRLQSQSRQLGEASVGAPNFCSNPVRKGKVVFPEKLIGRARQNFDMYSGYINISSAPDYLFYWFFSSQDQNPLAPIIAWSNGGPGCTSMEGATTEHGPLVLYDIKESCSGGSGKCDYTGQFSTNPYSWNLHANVLYIDQPKNVGYSFGYGAETKSSVEAANDFIIFYKEWLNSFPEFVNRPLIIAGESYGGHYVPAWSNAILDYNAQHPNEKIPLSGVVIGNGCVNDTVQGLDPFVKFQHNENLIDPSTNPKTQLAAQTAMAQWLGYTPNYYDYRIESISCSACYGYNYTAWSNWFLQSAVESSLNVCGDAGVDAFSGNAGGCISMGAFDSRDDFDYSGALGRTLDANIPVTLFYGKSDTACNYVGGLAMADTIAWKSTSEFKNSNFVDIEIAGAPVGQMKSLNGLSFLQIDSAGHMVPLDQPAAAYYALKTILDKI